MIRRSIFLCVVCCISYSSNAQQLDVEGDLIITNDKSIKAPAATIEDIETDLLLVKDRATFNSPVTTKKLTLENGADLFVSGNVHAEEGMSFGQDFAVKVKTLTLNTPNAVSSTVSIAHDINSLDIIRVTSTVNYDGAGAGISPGYVRAPNFEYYIEWNADDFLIYTVANSTSILNKECKITIFYKS